MTTQSPFDAAPVIDTWLALGRKGLVPAWFLSIGVAGMWIPAPDVPVSVLVLVVALFVVVIPALAVAVDVWGQRRREHRIALTVRGAIRPRVRAAETPRAHSRVQTGPIVFTLDSQLRPR